MAFGLSATAVAGLAGAGMSAYSAYKGSKGGATSTTQQQLDPRADAMLWGKDGAPGLLSQFQGMLTQQPGTQAYQQAGNDYLSNYGASDLGAIHGAANGLMSGNSAPTSTAAQSIAAGTALPAYAVGGKVNAPGQNNLDLSGSYQSLLGGGDTAALNNSMNAAVGATNAGYKTNVDNLTNSLMRTVLPSVRSNSVLAGQYGGSRQGIAEGNAISDYTNQLNNANTQLSATNSANTTAQAGNAYQQGQDRALSATQGLGAQQYGVAGQNMANEMQAQLLNVNNLYDAHKTNAGWQQQTNLTNQQAQQQTGLANQQAQLSTNAQNNSAAIGGAGLLGGLGSMATGAANSDLTRAQGVNGLLQPYLGMGGSSTSNQPLYQNTAGNLLGGALMGGQLGGQLGGMLGGSSGGTSMFNVPSSVGSFMPSTSMSIPSLPMWGG